MVACTKNSISKQVCSPQVGRWFLKVSQSPPSSHPLLPCRGKIHNYLLCLSWKKQIAALMQWKRVNSMLFTHPDQRHMLVDAEEEKRWVGKGVGSALFSSRAEVWCPPTHVLWKSILRSCSFLPHIAPWAWCHCSSSEQESLAVTLLQDSTNCLLTFFSSSFKELCRIKSVLSPKALRNTESSQDQSRESITSLSNSNITNSALLVSTKAGTGELVYKNSQKYVTGGIDFFFRT